MPNTEINIVQGDAGYPLNFTLTDSSSVAINLTGTTLVFKVQLFNTDVVKFSGNMTIDNAAAGTCHYTVQTTDFDQEGRYKAEISIVYPSSEVLSFVNIVIVAAPKLPAA